MNNVKTYTGKYAPNPKEFGRWVDTTSDANGDVVKVYRNNKWVDEKVSQPNNSLTKDEIIDLLVSNNDSLQRQINTLADKVGYLEREIKRLKRGTAITE